MSEAKNKGGRPRKPLDLKVIFELAKIGCTNKEIAAVAQVSTDTIENNCLETIHEGREHCKVSLRRAQLALALSGNCSMLIWLGKIILGQREIIAEELDQIKELLIKIHPSRLDDSKGD